MGMTPAKWQEFIYKSKQMQKRAAAEDNPWGVPDEETYESPFMTLSEFANGKPITPEVVKEYMRMEATQRRIQNAIEMHDLMQNPPPEDYGGFGNWEPDIRYRQHLGDKALHTGRQLKNFSENALAPYLLEKGTQGLIGVPYASAMSIYDAAKGRDPDWWNRYGQFTDAVHDFVVPTYDYYDKKKTDIARDQFDVDDYYANILPPTDNPVYNKTNESLTINPVTSDQLPTRDKSKYVPSAALNAGANFGTNAKRMGYWTMLKALPATGEAAYNYTGDAIDAGIRSLSNGTPFWDNYDAAKERTRSVVQPAYDFYNDMSNAMDEEKAYNTNYYYTPQSGLVDRNDLMAHKSEYDALEKGFDTAYGLAFATGAGATSKALPEAGATGVNIFNRARTGNPFFFGDFRKGINAIAPNSDLAAVFNALNNRPLRTGLQYLGDATGMSPVTNVLTGPQKFINKPFKENVNLLADTAPGQYNPPASTPATGVPSYYEYPTRMNMQMASNGQYQTNTTNNAPDWMYYSDTTAPRAQADTVQHPVWNTPSTTTTKATPNWVDQPPNTVKQDNSSILSDSRTPFDSNTHRRGAPAFASTDTKPSWDNSGRTDTQNPLK